MHPVFRVGLLLLLGVVLLARGLEMLNDHITAASQPARPAPAAEADPPEPPRLAEGSGSAAPQPVLSVSSPPLPPPTEAQLQVLRSGTPPAVATMLRELQIHQPTPALLDALDAADRRVASPDARRLVACHRGRAAARSLEAVFAALPEAPAEDRVWADPGARCLVQVIAARASEDPDGAVPVLVARAVASSDPAALLALASLDLPALPPEVELAIDDRADPRRRAAAVGVALALGAAAKWPDRVAAWVDDADREVRLQTIRALAFGSEDVTRLAGARAIAASAGERDVEVIAAQALAAGPGLGDALATVAADPAQPAFARAHATFLLSRRDGGRR